MKFAAVTTWAPRHWELYARRCVETFRAHWKDVALYTFDDAELEAACEWLLPFKRRHAHRPTDDYRMDAVRFAHKIAAIDLANQATDADVLVWIDADCVTHADVTSDWLAGLMGAGDFGYLRRRMKYPECGFMMFRRNAAGRWLIESIVNEYRTDALFKLPEWHDSFVIDAVRARLEAASALRSVSLSGNADRTHHPLINGPLGEKLDHLKGPRKEQGHSHGRDLKVLRSEAYWKGVTQKSSTADIRRAAARARQEANRRRGSA